MAEQKDDLTTSEPRTFLDLQDLNYDRSKPYLGDYGTVVDLVNQFASEIKNVPIDFRKGVGPKDVKPHVEGICQKYADIFLGRNPDYAKTPYNDIRKLGIVLRVRINQMTQYDDPGMRLFAVMAGQILATDREIQNGMDAEEAGKKLPDLLTFAAQKLTGISQ